MSLPSFRRRTIRATRWRQIARSAIEQPLETVSKDLLSQDPDSIGNTVRSRSVVFTPRHRMTMVSSLSVTLSSTEFAFTRGRDSPSSTMEKMVLTTFRHSCRSRPSMVGDIQGQSLLNITFYGRLCFLFEGLEEHLPL